MLGCLPLNKALPNDELWSSLHSARKREREALRDLLGFLAEVERRSLHLERGFSSLWALLTTGLGYDEASAHRRLQALRAAKAVPEIPDKVGRGELTLSAVAAGQGLVRALSEKRAVPVEERRELFRSLESLTKKEAEKLLLEKVAQEKVVLKGLTERPDQLRSVAPNRMEVRFSAGPEFERKLARLRELYFHKNPNALIEELLNWAISHALQTLDPKEREAKREARREARKSPPSAAKVNAEPAARSPASTAKVAPAATPVPLPQPLTFAAKALPKRTVRDSALTRAGHRCQYQDRKTGRRCQETHGLELDHVFPRSWGGDHSPENIRILCDAHNRWKSDTLPTAARA